MRGGGLGGSAYVLPVIEGAGQHAARVEPYAGLRRKKSQVTFTNQKRHVNTTRVQRPSSKQVKESTRIIVVSTKFGMLSRSVTISHVLRSNILSPSPPKPQYRWKCGILLLRGQK